MPLDIPHPTGGSDKQVYRPTVASDAGAEQPRRRLGASALSVGNVLYLASVGVIATAIAGIFFGAGLLVLAPTARGTISSSNLRDPASQARSLLPGLLPLADGDHRAAEGEL